jgi:hypothetical protein
VVNLGRVFASVLGRIFCFKKTRQKTVAMADVELVFGLLTPTCWKYVQSGLLNLFFAEGWRPLFFFFLSCLFSLISQAVPRLSSPNSLATLSSLVQAFSRCLKSSTSLVLNPLTVSRRLVSGLNPSGFVFLNFFQFFQLFCVCSNAIGISYNSRAGYPFSTYGEGVFILIQSCILGRIGLFSSCFSFSDMLLLILIAKYNKELNAVFFASFLAFLGFLVACFSESLVPASVMSLLQAGSIAIFSASRIPQIWENFSHKHTGLLSIITVLLTFVGALARIFTTLQEVNDVMGDAFSIFCFCFFAGSFGWFCHQCHAQWNFIGSNRPLSRKHRKPFCTKEEKIQKSRIKTTLSIPSKFQ